MTPCARRIAAGRTKAPGWKCGTKPCIILLRPYESRTREDCPKENRKKWMRPRAAMAEEHRFVSVVASVMLYHEPRAPEAADVPRIVNSMVTRSKRKPKPDNPEETWAWVGPRYHLQGTKSEFQSSRWLKFRQPSEKDNEAYNRDLARRLSRFHPADVQTQTWSCIHETYPQSRWI